MARHTPKRKCLHCKAFFVPDPRCVKRQRYCFQPEYRKASKAASQQRWLDQPANRDYFKGPTHVERVRAWRQAHPGYWRHKALETPHALQEDFRRAIQLDDEVFSWIVTALKASHRDAKQYHDERVGTLQKQYNKLQSRLDKMYVDKLDGSISQEQYDRMSGSFRNEQDDLLR